MATGPSFRLPHALVLGAVQGPTEVLPLSSSGHTALLPPVLDWPYARLPGAHRKAFEVALHAGAAGGLAAALIQPRGPLRRLTAPPGTAAEGLGRRAATVTVMTLPAVLLGLLLGRPIEERLGGPRGVARAQLGAGALLLFADRLPALREASDAGPLDGLVIGMGQAAALVPGVSRAGGVLTVARALRFRRRDAVSLSWQAALPVLAGATALKGVRLSVEGLPRELVAPFTAGVGAAFASTWAFSPLAVAVASRRALAAAAAYRIVLGGCALLALRRRSTAGRAPARLAGGATSAPRAPRRPVRARRPRWGRRSRRRR